MHGRQRQPEEPVRVRLPHGREILGIIEGILGASRLNVNCLDGKRRMCRIPGKFRKRVRLSVGDVVLVEPWSVQPDEKADVVWLYNKTQMAWLRSRGYVK